MDRYDGFAEFVHVRIRALSRTAYLLTGNRQEAEDLVQIALTRAALRWPALRADNPEGYVRRILYTEHVSRWRRRRLREVLAAAPPDLPAPDPSDAAAVRLAVRRALDRLTRKQRAVIVLRYFEDLTEVQTAEVLGIRPGTVKSQTRDALARIRELAPDLAVLVGRPDPVEVSP